MRRLFGESGPPPEPYPVDDDDLDWGCSDED